MLTRFISFALISPAIALAVFAPIPLLASLFGSSKPIESLQEALGYTAILLSVGIAFVYIIGVLPSLSAASVFSLMRAAGVTGWQINIFTAFTGGMLAYIMLASISYFIPLNDPDSAQIVSIDVWMSPGLLFLAGCFTVGLGACSALRQRHERRSKSAN